MVWAKSRPAVPNPAHVSTSRWSGGGGTGIPGGYQPRHTRPVEITARADYTLRALAHLAAANGGPLTVQQIADAQDIPAGFLQNILLQLRRRGIVRSQRGSDGGYRLARPAAEITLADAFRAV